MRRTRAILSALGPDERSFSIDEYAPFAVNRSESMCFNLIT